MRCFGTALPCNKAVCLFRCQITYWGANNHPLMSIPVLMLILGIKAESGLVRSDR